ncbi:MAG: hypothetical protein KIT72_01265 [Polyangiaceae bacterium]|nr:hypothetical protein [Polyangiaceae bacterium]MCW5789025.1 hypothetical protein [Polyangiaceae bacterium]
MPTPKQVAAALKELKQVGRREPRLAVEGCIRLLTGLKAKDGALDDVLREIIDWLGAPMRRAKPPEPELMDWLERLAKAYRAQPARLASLGARFGALCGSPAIASRWADRFREELYAAQPARAMKATLSSSKLTKSAKATQSIQSAQLPGEAHALRLPYLSALSAAGRHEELRSALEPGANSWAEAALGVKALAALGQVDAALSTAHQYAHLTTPVEHARACEAALLAAGREEDAYREHALLAAQETRYVAWFRALRQRYPRRDPKELLSDLVSFTTSQHGEAIRGKWFAAAKEAELYQEAIALARSGDADTRTLLRAARDFAEREPHFALQAGLTALTAMLEAGPYEVTKTDVWTAYNAILLAANAANQRAEVIEQLRALLRPEAVRDRLVTRTLSRELNLS